MPIKKKSTNSLAELVEKSKNNISNIDIPENKQQVIDEKRILRPYLDLDTLTHHTYIDHISTTYRPHIDHKTDTTSTTKRTHIDHISSTTIDHIDHISSTESSTESSTKLNSDTPPLEAEKTFSCLSESQKKILTFIYDSCKLLLSKTSANITLDEFATCCSLKKKSVKTTLRRLEKNNLITLRSFKRGRQGWRKYELPENVYQEILLVSKFGAKSSTESSTESTTFGYVSSSYNIKTTTNLPEAFQQIDYYPLADFGFDESHIIQIYREHTKHPELALSTEMIQNSINALAYDLKHNDVAGNFKNSPTVVLTAMLKKGQPYSSKTPHKVLTPREEAIQEYIAAQERRHQKIQELENKAKELMLQEWLRSMSEAELATFAPQEPCPLGMPERVYQTSCRKKALAAAQEYFITMLWPQKLGEITEAASKPKNKQFDQLKPTKIEQS